jgi:hypothetical protein
MTTKHFFTALILAILTACQTIDPEAPTRAAMQQAITQEQPGNYFIGRRMYKVDYKMWGWIRQPGQQWKTAQLVMLNEQKHLAPDRQQNKIGFDNNYEYRLEGYFSGQTVYEPASNGFYPEFVLLKATVTSTSPINIYRYKEELIPEYRLLTPPSG